MVKVKAHELRTKSKDDLVKQLDELKTELAALRVAKVIGGAASKLSKIKPYRKSIARVLTVISQNRRAQLRKFYHGKKYLPKDLRPKKTRAIRKALSPAQANKVTLKQEKKRRHFGRRKYAVKA
eukprot:NODE_2859_length_491_cov_131.184066_g2809_i0.p1 GENE.NODE_2859_length_491_cov_131.184066_g2809_i0~~NODE_2859_length_491_cov_131.184066_g2809_i0.p1  ORF type:complete len:124 (+),score=39.10 NODE_2859_length_491_cov_131.184066_g2809_i0:91-462(+)